MSENSSIQIKLTDDQIRSLVDAIDKKQDIVMFFVYNDKEHCIYAQQDLARNPYKLSIQEFIDNYLIKYLNK